MFRLQIAEGSPIGQVPEQIEGYAAEVLCKSERVHVLWTDNGHKCTNLGLRENWAIKWKVDDLAGGGMSIRVTC